MSSAHEKRRALLEQIYLKTIAREMSWRPRVSENSFESPIGEFNIHVDKMDKEPEFALWFFKDAKVVGHLYNNSFPNIRPSIEGFASYSDILSALYRAVEEQADGSELDELAKLLSSQ